MAKTACVPQAQAGIAAEAAFTASGRQARCMQWQKWGMDQLPPPSSNSLPAQLEDSQLSCAQDRERMPDLIELAFHQQDDKVKENVKEGDDGGGGVSRTHFEWERLR